jgi:hypothetical protein
LQFRESNEAPGQLVTVEGTAVEAEEGLRPLAAVCEMKDPGFE